MWTVRMESRAGLRMAIAGLARVGGAGLWSISCQLLTTLFPQFVTPTRSDV